MKKPRKKRKRRFFKFFIVILILIISFNIYKNRTTYGKITNSKYKGIGQEQIKNKNGYNTIFITEEENQKQYIEYKQGKGASWGQNLYWGGTIFLFSSAQYNKEKVIEHLKSNRPILICVWNKYDNRWTEKSHYMVLLNCNLSNQSFYIFICVCSKITTMT